MSRRTYTPAQAARSLRNLRSELKRDPTPERRAQIEYQLPLLVDYIGSHCLECGLRLTDPVSLARGVGEECKRKRQDPRDDFTSAEHADEAADLGNADDVMGAA